jgi:hypothetical protein
LGVAESMTSRIVGHGFLADAFPSANVSRHIRETACVQVDSFFPSSSSARSWPPAGRADLADDMKAILRDKYLTKAEVGIAVAGSMPLRRLRPSTDPSAAARDRLPLRQRYPTHPGE